MPTTLYEVARIQKVINYQDPPSLNIKHDIITTIGVPKIYRNTIFGFAEDSAQRPEPNTEEVPVIVSLLDMVFPEILF